MSKEPKARTRSEQHKPKPKQRSHSKSTSQGAHDALTDQPKLDPDFWHVRAMLAAYDDRALLLKVGAVWLACRRIYGLKAASEYGSRYVQDLLMYW